MYGRGALIVVRRKDYELFCGMHREWLQLWQVGKNVYRVENMFIPQFWRDIWGDFKPGRRLRAVMVTLRHMITYYSEAPTVVELERQDRYYREIVAKFRRYAAES